MLTLTKEVKSLYLQFSFSNEKAVPGWLPLKEEETPAEAKVRQAKNKANNGTCVIQPTEGCSLESLLDEVKSAGFTLVDAYYQPRQDPNNPRKRWYMARYIFIRTEDVTRDELGDLREGVEVGLKELCLLAFWRVRAFQNPFFKDQEPVPGLSAASVNLEARKPRFTFDGELILEWERNANGEKIGDAPRPIEPYRYLRVVGGALQLTTDDPADAE